MGHLHAAPLVAAGGPESPGHPHRAALAVAGVALAMMGLGLSARLAHSSAPYDDAFITFRYARNFAEGVGFVYNPGEHYLGTTAPAFGLLLGIVARSTGIDPVTTANWLSGLALALAAWCAAIVVTREHGLAAGLTTAVLTFANPMLVSTWGGEWLVACAMVAAAFAAVSHGRLMPAAVLGSIAVLLRAEAAIALAVILGDALARRVPGRWRAVLVSAAIGLAWVLTAAAVTGGVVPDTFAAKLAHGRSGLFQSVPGGLARGFVQFVKADAAMAAVALLAWHGALLAVTRRGVVRHVLLWAGLHLAFFTVLRLPFYHWYLVPIAFAISVAAGAGVEAAWVFARVAWRSPRVARVAAVLLAVGLVAAAVAAEARSTRHWVRTKPDPREQLYNTVGQWLAASTPPDARVAYLEIGRIGYFSGRPLVDLMGLVTPGAAEKVAVQDFQWALHEYNPDYYLSNDSFGWTSGLTREPWFAQVYEPVSVFHSNDGSTILTVFHRRAGTRVPPSPGVDIVSASTTAVVGDVRPGHSAGQVFTATRDRLFEVQLFTATYARDNQGTLAWRVERTSGGVVGEGTAQMRDVPNNGWWTLSFAPVAGSAGQGFRVTVEATEAAPGSAVTLWYDERAPYQSGTRLENGAPAAGDLVMRLRYDVR